MEKHLFFSKGEVDTGGGFGTVEPDTGEGFDNYEDFEKVEGPF